MLNILKNLGNLILSMLLAALTMFTVGVIGYLCFCLFGVEITLICKVLPGLPELGPPGILVAYCVAVMFNFLTIAFLKILTFNSIAHRTK